MRKIKQRILIAIFCILSLVALPVVFSDSAYATSVYDDAYTNLNELHVGQDHFYNSQTCGESVDLAHSWESYILDPGAQLASGYDVEYEELRESFQNAVATGSYGVSETMDTAFYAPAQYMKTILVYWTEDADAMLNWVPFGSPTRYGVDYSSSSGNIHFAQIGNKIGVMGTGGCEVGWATPDITGYSSLSSLYNWVSTDIPAGTYGYHANTNLFVKGAGINEPQNYAGNGISADPSPAKYVAMGDSFSSSEGSFNYNLLGGDCHRSTDSYAHYLAEYVPLDPPNLVACSGAVTDDLFNAMNATEVAQTNHLGDETTRVTLTIGGNDTGFADIIRACADYYEHPGYLCSTNLTIQASIANAMSGLAGDGSPKVTKDNRPIHSYNNVLASIMADAPNAKIYIAGYPHLFGSNPYDFTADVAAPGDATCFVNDEIATIADVKVSYTDAQWLNDQTDLLNGLIEDAVNDIDSNRVIYVPPTYFENHGLCDASYSYINGVSLDGTEPLNESFHPNNAGILAYGYEFENKINLP